MGGLTADERSVHVRINNFTPFVYVELPRRVLWNRDKCRTLFEFFQQRYKSEGPIKYSMFQKFKLHYRVLANVLFLTFPTNKAAVIFGSRCARYSMSIYSIGSFQAGEFKVHEQNIDPILKLTAARRINLASWVKVKETIPDDEVEHSVERRKFTTADIDLYCDWKDISPCEAPEAVVVRPKYCSFDIECYSKNHNSKLPDPEQKENKVFQIALIFGRFRQPMNRCRKVLLTLFDPLDIEGVEVRRHKTERDLLLDFTRLVQEENPDVFIGYNIMKFDWHYMISRAEMLGFYPRFSQLSRIIGERAENRKLSWSSSAYGQQAFKFLDCHGRTNVDVLLEVERNFRLPKYSLDAVAEHFLRENKVDISPKQLFMLYQLTEDMLPLVQGRKITPGQCAALKKRVKGLLPTRKCYGAVRNLRRRLLRSKPNEMCDLVREAMRMIGVYCVQDTVLPIRLAENLNLWTTMEEMSNCMHVPITYLHTRGQQIKVVAQMFRETMFSNLIIPYNKKDATRDAGERYQGATCIDPVAGDYENVATADFASLYPSVLIAFNICYTTIVADNDPKPDEECHVLAWSDHCGCTHDPKKRKRKKEDVLCSEHRYRFRRVKVHPDGTLEGEGLMPRLERCLLTERKKVKAEMQKMQAQMKQQKGQATDEDIAFFRKKGWSIIRKGSMDAKSEELLEVNISVLDAKQKALKVSANSMYGAMGVRDGYCPLIPGAASVTAMGRKLIMDAIDFITKRYASMCTLKVKNVKPKLIYGDTDSAMIVFEGATLAETFALAQEATSMATHVLKCQILGIAEDATLGPERVRIDAVTAAHLPSLTDEEKVMYHSYKALPIDFEFENVYGRYLMLTKKRYIGYAVNKRGETVGVTKKGVVLARRDNCKYLRDAYKAVVTAVLDRKTENEVMSVIYDRVQALFTRQIPDADLIIYVGVQNVMNYAKKRELKRGRQVVERVFIDAGGNPIDDPIGPLDPRLVYPNYPQTLLALKMLMRGEEIPVNTRLEFLYLDPGYEVQHQGEKAEDFTYFKENKASEGLKPDLLHYVEKQLMTPLSELLYVKYPRNHIPFETPDARLQRCLKAFTGKNDLYRFRLDKVRKETKVVTCSHGPTCKKHTSNTYAFSGVAAKVEFVLQSFAAGKISSVKNAELLQACRAWKARYVLDQAYRRHKVRKRPPKRPTKAGENLPVGTRVMHWPSRTHGTISQVHEVKEELPAGRMGRAMAAVHRKVTRTFTVTLDTDSVVNEVSRDDVAPLYMRDGTVMKDILEYRTSYKAVVEQIRDLFSSLSFT